MHFENPQVLWMMGAAIPALIGLFYWSWRVKQKLIRQFIGARLLPNLTFGVSPGREKLRLALLVLAVAGIMLALARPQWGFGWEEAHQKGLDIIVAIDTSRSMLAKDVLPNRLDKCKLAVMDLMRLCKTDRMGLVVFAGDAFLQAPLTLDDQAFQQAVDFVTVGIVPEGGTSLSSAIRATTQAFEKGDDNHKVLVLFTDGDDHDADEDTLAAAKEAAAAGLRIFTVGVGTPEGELLQITDDQGNTSFIKDDAGNAVKSRLNEKLLREIATIGNEFYLPLQGATPMEVLYQRGLAQLPKSDESTLMTRVYVDRYHWPLAFAVICLILEALLPERNRSRAPRNANPAAATLQKTAAVIVAMLLIPLAAHGSPSSAYNDYLAGNYKKALDEYLRLLAQNTNDYRLHYDAGAAAYNATNFEEAQKQFTAALNSSEIIGSPTNQERTYFNLGNTLYRLGEGADTDKKKDLWREAMTNYSRALSIHLNTNDVEAANNLAFVQQQLQQMEQQQKKQDKNDDSKQQEPDAAAKEAKARSDAAVMRRQYKQALDIMEDCVKTNPTASYYSDYIKRLQEVNGVANTNHP